MCALLCCADSWAEVELFGRSKKEWLRQTPEHTSTERRYYISSIAGLNAKAMLGHTRGHWGIENKVHWSLDVIFRKDTLRNRISHSAENFSRIRRLYMNLLRRDKTCKIGLKGKRMKACLDQGYLLRLVSQGI